MSSDIFQTKDSSNDRLFEKHFFDYYGFTIDQSIDKFLSIDQPSLKTDDLQDDSRDSELGIVTFKSFINILSPSHRHGNTDKKYTRDIIYILR